MDAFALAARSSASSPVTDISPEDAAGPREGSGLCLSGGGYRAMLFHLGALWRLRELAYLSRLQRISSVSGGSIVAGRLALAWRKLDGLPAQSGDPFVSEVVLPIRRLASATIDVPAVLLGTLLPGTVADRIAGYYRRYLFGDATLQALPSDHEGPRFVLNASNMQSGALWRFMKPYMRDYRVGEIRNPDLPLARAVAASSAFPPVLSPCTLRLDAGGYTPGTGTTLQRPPYTTRVVLTDGGVYDNLGLETVWKRYRTVLVSDAGGQMQAAPRPPRGWLRHTGRVLELIDNQVRSLRKRQVISAFELPRTDSMWRAGTYWGIRSDITHYGLAEALPCPVEQTAVLAAWPTRLARVPDLIQERLINWGYAVCDAAMRRWVVPGAAPPRDFPYPKSRVG